MTTASPTGIKVAGADLNTIFEGRTTAAIANTGIKSGGVDIATLFEKLASGTERTAATGIKKAGVDIKTLFAEIGTVSSIIATPAGGTISRQKTAGTCYAGVSFKTDGIEYVTPFTGASTFTISAGDWTDGVNGPSSYWIERTINSGSIAGDTIGTGRVQLGSVDRYLRVSQTGTPPVGGEYNTTASVTVRFYAASSGGSPIGSATYTLSASKVNPF